MKKIKIYLDTSIISHLAAEDSPEKHGVLTQKSRDDCRHIAIATIIGCKYIISWNFKHFVNIRVINKVQAVNKLLGYEEVAIVPPPMISEGDDEW